MKFTVTISKLSFDEYAENEDLHIKKSFDEVDVSCGLDTFWNTVRSAFNFPPREKCGLFWYDDCMSNYLENDTDFDLMLKNGPVDVNGYLDLFMRVGELPSPPPPPVVYDARRVLSVFISNRMCQSLPSPPCTFDPSLTMPMEKKVTLKTVDRNFEIDVAVAVKSLYFRHMIEVMTEEGEIDNMSISLEGRVNSFVLDLVIQYCEKCFSRDQEIDSASSDSDDSDDSDDLYVFGKRTPEVWDSYFYKKEVDLPTLFALILAADLLMIRGLVNLTCKKVADMIEGKTTNGICEFFKIENGLNPEEVKSLDEYVSILCKGKGTLKRKRPSTDM